MGRDAGRGAQGLGGSKGEVPLLRAEMCGDVVRPRADFYRGVGGSGSLLYLASNKRVGARPVSGSGAAAPYGRAVAVRVPTTIKDHRTRPKEPQHGRQHRSVEGPGKSRG
ncbi:hypothetical protein GCM10010253_59320 [Streptomyces badius]|uniref:Uncharacterized protein n=1 Tax=Streptomyces badius TaxID=1941 RepID=A0ABQ2TLJ5_STRBA|nr:hypothetical protein GCM10010253_59320 [Streptomyces badius]